MKLVLVISVVLETYFYAGYGIQQHLTMMLTVLIVNTTFAKLVDVQNSLLVLIITFNMTNACCGASINIYFEFNGRMNGSSGNFRYYC